MTDGPKGLSRRRFLGSAGLATGGAVALAACGSSGATAHGSASVSPYGPRQAGIATLQQDRLAFAAFDLTTRSRAAVASLLRSWTAALEQMTDGRLVAGNDEVNPQSPPQDTGEALGLGAANLTVTIGFGPSMFDERFGLEAKRPEALARIPALPGDTLDPDISGGDLCVQACADDPVVAFHAVRNLRRLAEGSAVLRWTQLGFGKTAANSTAQATPRNLMGFKDGTNNLKRSQELEQYVWVGDETDQPWMRNGSYVVTRRIRMFLESWDRDYLADQQNVIGRIKDTGAPLGRTGEFDAVPLDASGADGELLIPEDAHIRLASQQRNGISLLRRGYDFTDGTDPTTGELVAGLFFIAYQKDPRTQFVPLQRMLGSKDALNEYIRHTSSAVFAVPPGFVPGGWVGESLFA